MRCTSVGVSALFGVILFKMLSSDAFAETLKVVEDFESYPSQSVISVSQGSIVDSRSYPFWIPSSGSHSVYASNGTIQLGFAGDITRRVTDVGFNHILIPYTDLNGTHYGSCPVIIKITAYLPGPDGTRIEERLSAGGKFTISAGPGESIGYVILSNWLGGDSCLPVVDDAEATVEVIHPDLSIQSLVLSQDGAPVEDTDGDGLPNLVPGASYRARVEIGKTEIPSGMDPVYVSLYMGGTGVSQMVDPVSQSVADLDFAATGKGLQVIKVAVDRIPGESDTSNNERQIQVNVGGKYKLVAYVNGLQVQDGTEGLKYPLAPANLRGFGSGVTSPGPSTPISVTCIDTTTGEAVTGCYFMLHMESDSSPNASNGGHTHATSDFLPRPMQFQFTQNVFPLDAPMPVDTAGQYLPYTPPEVAGDLVLTISGWSDGSLTTPLEKVAPITFQIAVTGLSEIPASLFYRLTGVYPNSSTNPNTQFHFRNHFVSGRAKAEIIPMAQEYFLSDSLASMGVNDASLPQGGLFDLDVAWDDAGGHKLHRSGNSVDVDRCARSTIPDNPNDRCAIFPTQHNPNNQVCCPAGWIIIDRIDFKDLCKKYQGRVAPEPTHHCEF